MENNYTLLLGAKLIDGRGNTPMEDSAIVIKGEKITDIGTREGVNYPQDAKKIDLPGKTVLPGLIDAHIHLIGTNSLTLVD